MSLRNVGLIGRASTLKFVGSSQRMISNCGRATLPKFLVGISVVESLMTGWQLETLARLT